jgi:D-alanyl-D-alanine carboxypeptidase/D-alanyl-D-alanine-endopeptidase (penicillin-binding protein 4)
MNHPNRLPLRAARFLFACLFSFAFIPARAEDAGHGPDVDLVRAIDAALDVPGLLSGWQGVVIQSLADNTFLYERNADHTFLPASNNKLLTSGVALEALGPDFVYRTRIFRVGSLSADGTLHGDLVLRGAGDPLFSPAELRKMAAQVRQAGIRRVTGCLRYDDTLFDRQRLGDVWAWDDEPYYYSAQISALNLNENMVFVQVRPGRKPGAPVRVVISPTDRYVTLRNSAVTGATQSRSSLVIDRQRGQNVVLIRGSLPIDVAAKDNLPTGVTVEDPSRYAAFVLAEFLRQAGVQVSGELRDGPPAPSDAPVVAEHVSMPLSELLRHLNKPSDNLVAECLLKTVGAAKQKQGSSGAGWQVARDFFQRIGLDVDRLQMADGSGLSRINFVTPRNLVRLLAYVHTTPQFSVLYDSLPIAGVDGSLRSRLKNTPAEKNCHAKTGYVSNVSSLSGYVTTKDGEMLAFSILMNNHLAGNNVCRAAQDTIVALLADYARKTNRQDE